MSCAGTLPHLLTFPTLRSSDLKIDEPSTTGRWRLRPSVIKRMHSSTVWLGDTVTTGLVMMSQTRVSFDERDCSTTLRRSEEHTSEVLSPCNLVCRLLLDKQYQF